jgi:DNA-binding transcriptional MerR regulator
VRRLYRILALRSLGLSLDDVAATLGDQTPLRDLARRQLEHVAEERDRLAGPHDRLSRLVAALESADGATTDDYLETIAMIERYYTPEQLEQLAARYDDSAKAAEREWPDLIAQLREHAERDTDLADPDVQRIIARWDALVEQFTGGDPEIRKSLQRMYDEQGSQEASRGMIDPAVMAYAQRARDARAR